MTNLENTLHTPAEEGQDLPPEVRQQVQALEAQVRDLQNSQQAVLFDQAPVPSFLLTSEGRIQDVNPLGAALVGLAREALLGMQFGPLLVPDARPHFAALLAQVFEAPVQRSGEVQLHWDGHAPLTVRLDLKASGGDGRLDRCHLVVTDLTSHKETQRERLADHVTVNGSFQGQLSRVRTLNEEFEQVITSTLQQLQPPIGRVMTALSLLRRIPDDRTERGDRLLLHIEQADQQLFAIIESVRRYMQARQVRVWIRTVDLGAVLREVLKEVEPLLADRRVQFTHDPLPTLQGDSQVLQNILTEYISNALKFTRTREQARLHVIVRETETEYHIGVEDNGVGFNTDDTDRLFRLFQRGHPSKVYEGSGLGLAVVRLLCERFGGRVWGEGSPDRGATFWFAWPKNIRIHQSPDHSEQRRR